MRQPTRQEARAVDFAFADAAIASGEHDLYVLEMRRTYGVLGKTSELDPKVLSDDQRKNLAELEANAKTRGLEAQLAVVRLRRACEVPKDAQFVDGAWFSPITKQRYGEHDDSDGGAS